MGVARRFVELCEAEPEHLCRRKGELITLLRRSFEERRLAIKVITVAPGADQLQVDEHGDARFPGARTDIVRGNQPCDCGFDHACLSAIEEAPRV